MDVFEAIHSRRSIRKFDAAASVTEEQLHKILDAAMIAPSAGNAQPWQFIVIDDRAILEKVPQINPFAKMAETAPMGILVCGDLSLEKYAGYWVQDCSAAIQNMLLAVHAIGLGAVWTGIHPMADREEGFSKLLNLPENVRPLGLIVLGVPDQPSAEKSRYNEDRVHRNGWQGK